MSELKGNGQKVKINSVETQLADWKKSNEGKNYIARNLDGIPIPSIATPLTLGECGPILMQDDNTLQFIQDFSRMNIPERVTHAKGFGVHGVFKVTQDISDICCAKIFSKIGKETEVFCRFSSSNIRHESDGLFSSVLSIKFYTEDGNWDLLTRQRNPFSINDPMLFIHCNHGGDFNPAIQVLDNSALWDLQTRLPETIGNVLSQYSDLGNPRLFQNVTTHAINTFKLINSAGEYVYCKWTVKSNQGFEYLSDEEGKKLLKKDPDFQIRSLFNAVAKGDFPSWTLCLQTMTEDQIANFGNKKTGEKWNAFDITLRWPEEDYPLRKVGVMTLNRNVENHFNETEQSAFSPGRLVPGMEAPLQDKVLQGRLFAYPDTQIYRLGINNQQLPINSPRGIPEGNPHTYERDGFMNGDTTNKGAPNYYPNSFGGPVVKKSIKNDVKKGLVKGKLERIENITPERDFFTQPREYWNSQTRPEQQRLVRRFASEAYNIDDFLKKRIYNLYSKVDPKLAQMLRQEMNRQSQQNQRQESDNNS